MEHGVLHTGKHIDPQNMFNMGGLRRKMPFTFWTFLCGGFALAGFPILTAGFWSKDEFWLTHFHTDPGLFSLLWRRTIIQSLSLIHQCIQHLLTSSRHAHLSYSSSPVLRLLFVKWPILYPLLTYLSILSISYCVLKVIETIQDLCENASAKNLILDQEPCSSEIGNPASANLTTKKVSKS